MPPMVNGAAKAERLALRGMFCFTGALFLIFVVGIALVLIYGSPRSNSTDVEGAAVLILLLGFGLPGLLATVIVIGLTLRFRAFAWAGLLFVGLYGTGIIAATVIGIVFGRSATHRYSLPKIGIPACGIAMLIGLLPLALCLFRMARLSGRDRSADRDLTHGQSIDSFRPK